MSSNTIPQSAAGDLSAKSNQSAKALPELYCERENCCGCTACASVCPVHAIDMSVDQEGFLYPEVDQERCIRCGKCLKVCAFKQEQRKKGFFSGDAPQSDETESYVPDVYAVRHKDEAVRGASRSGGIFTALSDAVLSEHGVVYGCVLTDDFRAVHIRAEDHAGRDRMRGSKYIQSDLGDVFQQVRKDLQQGRKVLFSGTSCQVAGLKACLGSVYENLLCVDIVCHGVPSPRVWQHYLKWQNQQNSSSVKNVNFRNKTDFGWKAHVETLTFANGKNIDSEVFKKLFYSHYILRPSCYQCPYKSVVHPGDITIADYWGIEKAAPELNDNKGVSLVLVNSQVGREYYERVKSDLEYRQTALEDSMQPPLKAPFPMPKNRSQFWEAFQNQPFDEIVKKYASVRLRRKCGLRIRKIKSRLKAIFSGR